MQIYKISCYVAIASYTVESLYDGHFRISIFCHFLLQYRGFSLSEVKNVLVIPVGTKIFVLIMVLLCP